MPKMMISPDRLLALLKPEGFWLRHVNSISKTITFIRPSAIPRLYEHLNVHGQGKVGEAVYAATAISGSTSASHDECVSEEDLTLLYTLETDKERHWTLVRNKHEAEIWEQRLARVADSHCRGTAQSKGPSLRERLQPVFSAVDLYIAKLGNVKAIFDSEFRYFNEAPAIQRSEAERLASLIGYIGESPEDIRLACLVVFLFAPDVEDREDAFRGKKWHEDPSLRGRIYLLVDYLREQRKLYAESQG
jgi:hypothetical protein